MEGQLQVILFALFGITMNKNPRMILYSFGGFL